MQLGSNDRLESAVFVQCILKSRDIGSNPLPEDDEEIRGDIFMLRYRPFDIGGYRAEANDAAASLQSGTGSVKAISYYKEKSI